MKAIDLTGQRFGRLLALRVVRYGEGRRMWECACDCGRLKAIDARSLLLGRSRSCDCAKPEFTASQKLRHGDARYGASTSEYEIWKSMRQRCQNEKSRAFRHYGGRGIKVCERWASYEAFLADVGRRPSPRHSIDRLNNDGNYEPGNVAWRLPEEQRANRRL